MNNKYRMMVISGIISVFVISSVLGYIVIREDAPSLPQNEPIPSAVPEKAAETEEPVSEVFRIQLSGTKLELMEGENIIRSKMISPELYPYMDIEELRVGTVYYSYEEALMNWESLSE